MVVDLAPLYNDEPGCQKASLGLLKDQKIAWTENDIKRLWVTVPQEMTSKETF
ncbi:MAG: hypothetical protein LBI10_12680 [Deltaproteobacteria bacterium]|jgi:hypothetical protein|nr:hypothetical protein [Deltaproteobacteria bacterium]